MSNFFLGQGNIGAIELRTVKVMREGVEQTAKVLEMRVFFDSYKRNAQGKLEQDENASFWKDVTIWNDRGERAFKLLKVGARVQVIGQIKGESWTVKETGEIRRGDFVVADDVFVSLARVDSITWREKAAEEAQTGGDQ